MIEKILLEDKGKASEEFVRIKKQQEKEELDKIIEYDRRRPRKSIYDIDPYKQPEKEERSY